MTKAHPDEPALPLRKKQKKQSMSWPKAQSKGTKNKAAANTSPTPTTIPDAPLPQSSHSAFHPQTTPLPDTATGTNPSLTYIHAAASSALPDLRLHPASSQTSHHERVQPSRLTSESLLTQSYSTSMAESLEMIQHIETADAYRAANTQGYGRSTDQPSSAAFNYNLYGTESVAHSGSVTPDSGYLPSPVDSNQAGFEQERLMLSCSTIPPPPSFRDPESYSPRSHPAPLSNASYLWQSGSTTSTPSPMTERLEYMQHNFHSFELAAPSAPVYNPSHMRGQSHPGDNTQVRHYVPELRLQHPQPSFLTPPPDYDALQRPGPNEASGSRAAPRSRVSHFNHGQAYYPQNSQRPY
ncbi:hypothetical protein BOTBODRAFT_377533 [Botryobasidium botryosum FD-172 SS1]|uniref:Uncharacterized protein n=1 Tax=Botryobasidium botryosum (strain FD-172 SS1) TaxID=930990 RepID=A0A067MYM0_BOTB1|nr:hypothetical protein BOTBODRAFT_377533 [Botryobasidium botryosum FD-172 SS1]